MHCLGLTQQPLQPARCSAAWVWFWAEQRSDRVNVARLRWGQPSRDRPGQPPNFPYNGKSDRCKALLCRPMTSPTPAAPSTATELAPSYALPLALLAIALPLTLWQRPAGAAVGLFSLFLLIQAGTLRLAFTATALEIYRGTTQIRHFPYADWQNWRVFWPGLPILFYFREVNSIHFLPILFDPQQLQTCLAPLPRRD